MKLLMEIKEEHDEVRGIILEIDNQELAEEKKNLFSQLVIDMLAHHRAEEEVAFAALPNEQEANALKAELVAEHKVIERLFQVILDSGDEGDWDANFQVVKEVFIHHMHEEEEELFAALRKARDRGALDALYTDFETIEHQAKDAARALLDSGYILNPGHALARQAPPR